MTAPPAADPEGIAKRTARRRITRISFSVAIVSSLLLVATFPPWNLWPLAWVALAPLYVAQAGTSRPFAAFWLAWIFGVPVFLIGAYWFLMLGGTWQMGIVPWAMLAFIEAIPFGLQAFFVAIVAPRLPIGHVLRPVLFASVWVTGEWMRGWGKVAFPWFLLAASQVHAPLPLIQILSVTGQWGLSFAIALCAALIGEAGFARRQGNQRRTAALTASAIAIPLVLAGIGTSLVHLRENEIAAAQTSSITIAGIQGDISKEDVQGSSSSNYHALVMGTYSDLTRTAAQGMEKPDLIVWPETVVPGKLLHDSELLPMVTALARSTHTSLLVGTVDTQRIRVPDEPIARERWTNTGLLFDSSGLMRDRYDKLQIVPIGEYFPLRSILGPIYKQFDVPDVDLEPGDATGLLHIPTANSGDAAVGAMICYDDVFPTQARDRVRRGAGVLTLMTSDDTFGKSSGPQQHADLDVLRSVETARYLVRAAATGPSEITTPTGSVESILPLGQRGFVQKRLPLMTGETPFVRWGDWFAWGCTLLAGGLGVLAVLSPRKKADGLV